VPYARGIVLTA